MRALGSANLGFAILGCAILACTPSSKPAHTGTPQDNGGAVAAPTALAASASPAAATAAASADLGSKPHVVNTIAAPEPLPPPLPQPPLVQQRPSCRPEPWGREQPLSKLLRSRSRRNISPTATNVLPQGSLSAKSQRRSLFVDTAARHLCGDYHGTWRVPPLPVSQLLGDLRFSVLTARFAGKSGRQWEGGHCSFGVELMGYEPSPPAVVLEAPIVPPFNELNSVEREGSATWLGLSFNGYAREFNRQGCRVVAVDLCAGEVRWVSPDLRSNGPIMRYGEYLITAYGFTAEPDFLYVFDKRTGRQVQRLSVPKSAEEFVVVATRLFVRTYDTVEELDILVPM